MYVYNVDESPLHMCMYNHANTTKRGMIYMPPYFIAPKQSIKLHMYVRVCLGVQTGKCYARLYNRHERHKAHKSPTAHIHTVSWYYIRENGLCFIFICVYVDFEQRRLLDTNEKKNIRSSAGRVGNFYTHTYTMHH